LELYFGKKLTLVNIRVHS